jgi:hypothetical protein
VAAGKEWTVRDACDFLDKLGKNEVDYGILLPHGSKIVRSRNYLRLVNADGHPIASHTGIIPYHRFVLYESLGRPDCSRCLHCGHILPWKTTISPVVYHVVCADHLDGNTKVNVNQNLAPSCWWCNANRSWAESYPEFWSNWRRWLADVPPAMRPDIRKFASDFGITIEKKSE